METPLPFMAFRFESLTISAEMPEPGDNPVMVLEDSLIKFIFNANA